jgi:hypothetical protein
MNLKTEPSRKNASKSEDKIQDLPL